MRIGLAYNQKPDPGTPASRDADPPRHSPSDTIDAFAEWDDAETIDAVAGALAVFGDVVRLEAVGDFAARLAAARVDLLFNMAEGWSGPNREAHVPAIAEFLGIPYTASDPLTLALALHKGRAKEILSQRRIPTAPFALVESAADVGVVEALDFPIFLKPVWEGSSKGIVEANYVDTPAAARRRALELLAQYRQPVLAEAYLPGDEFTVAVLGNGPDTYWLPIIRYRFDALPDGAIPIMGYEAKWIWDRPGETFDVLECPARVPEPLADQIGRTAVAAYHALGCRDWARIDLRLDAGGVPNVVELNPLPGILPDLSENSCLPCAAAVAGMEYNELIQSVVHIAWRRITGGPLAAVSTAEAIA